MNPEDLTDEELEAFVAALQGRSEEEQKKLQEEFLSQQKRMTDFLAEKEEHKNKEGALSTIMGGLDYLFPMQAASRDAAYRAAINKGAGPISAEAARQLAAFTGLGADIIGYATSPTVKVASLGVAATAKAAPKLVAKGAAIANKAPALSVYGKNVIGQTGDATLINNTVRTVNGEDMEFGINEVLSGVAGGLTKSKGEMRFEKKAEIAKNYAARNNADLNFAERQTGKKGKAAIQEVITKEIKPGESFEGAVDRLGASLDNLNADFYKYFDTVKDFKIDINPREILQDLDDYAIKSTKHLGSDFAKKISETVNNSFESYLRTIEINRLVSQGGITERAALDFVNDIPLDKLYKRIGNLTLGEMDYIKRGMQARTSAYNRGPGTMERQGLESLANKEGSEGILNHFQKQIDTDLNLPDNDKMAIINRLNEASVDLGNDLAEQYLKVLRENKIISGADLQKYMDLNKTRSVNIGKLKIFERAQEKYQAQNASRLSLMNDLGNINEAGRQPLGGLARNATSQLYSNHPAIIGGIQGTGSEPYNPQDKVRLGR